MHVVESSLQGGNYSPILLKKMRSPEVEQFVPSSHNWSFGQNRNQSLGPLSAQPFSVTTVPQGPSWCRDRFCAAQDPSILVRHCCGLDLGHSPKAKGLVLRVAVLRGGGAFKRWSLVRSLEVTEGRASVGTVGPGFFLSLFFLQTCSTSCTLHEELSHCRPKARGSTHPGPETPRP